VKGNNNKNRDQTTLETINKNKKKIKEMNAVLESNVMKRRFFATDGEEEI